MIKLFSAGLLGVLLVGCASSLITNLTPTVMPRNETGIYPIEMQLDTSQQTLREDSLFPMVVVGTENYPMRRTLKTNNRWEALVPIPKDTAAITYHFKVNYQYNRFGKPGDGSKTSSEYTLTIVEK